MAQKTSCPNFAIYTELYYLVYISIWCHFYQFTSCFNAIIGTECFFRFHRREPQNFIEKKIQFTSCFNVFFYEILGLSPVRLENSDGIRMIIVTYGLINQQIKHTKASVKART